MIADLPTPENARGFHDPLKLREWLFANTKNAFTSQLNKLETDDFKVNVKNLNYKFRPFSLKDQKNSILERKDVTVPLKATFELTNKKTGKVVESKEVTVANVPYITERNTAIYNGSEYTPINQMRINPGVYSRVRQTGEPEAFINVKSGTGLNGKLMFSPSKLVFIYSIQSTNFHLYSMLHDFNISDSDIEKCWGKEILLRNKQGYDSTVIDKLFSKIYDYKTQ